MRTVLAVLAAVSFSATAFAAEPAADEAAAPECELCAARAAVMNAGKPQVTKLTNGTLVMVTAKGKKVEELKAAGAELDAVMKRALEGKAKLDPACEKMVSAIKDGKVLVGRGEMKDGVVIAYGTSDAELVKTLHEAADQMTAKK